MTGPDRIRFSRVSARMPAVRRFDSAFTLLELMVVVVIIGLLSGLAVNSFITANAEAQLEGDAQKLLLNLRIAKQAANKTGLRHFILIKPPNNIEVWRDRAPADLSLDEKFDTLLFSDALDVKTFFGLNGSLSGVTTPPDSSFYGPDKGASTAGLTRTIAATEDCVDAVPYPAKSTNTLGWARKISNNYYIEACGSPIADMTEGIAYLTSTQSKDKIYAVGFSGGSSIQLQLFRYSKSTAKWEVL